MLQRKDDGAIKPIAYFSRQTNKDKQKYHSYELETLAVISSLQRYRVYLYGFRFKIISDYSALRATFLKRDLLPRIARWWIQLLVYDCFIEYRAGIKMPHADALSRSPYEPSETSANIEDIGLLHIELGDWLLCAQLQDPELKRIHEILSHNNSDESCQQICNDYTLKYHRIFREEADGLRWAVPRTARQRIVKICHDDIDHPGVEKTLNELQADY